MRRIVSLVVLLASPLIARAEGDPEAGRLAFNKCSICHSIKEGESRVGPSLYGVVGRAAHSVPSYAYSEAMKKNDATWDKDSLDAYLADPRKAVPGTKMIFPGLKNDAERANVIAYLTTLN